MGHHLPPLMDAVRLGTDMDFALDVGGADFRFFTFPIHISDFPEPWAFGMAIPGAEVHAETYAMIEFAVITGIVTLVLVLLAAMLMSRSIAWPIVKMANVLNDIASGSGDLTVKLPEDGYGETAAAARYFNQTIEKIRTLVVSIKRQAEVLADIGNDLASNMAETAAAMNEIAANLFIFRHFLFPLS